MSSEPVAAEARSSALAVAALSLAIGLSSLGTSIVNVGLPSLADAFSASFQQVQWIVLSYLLAITALVVGAGRLGDLVGRRRVLLAGIVLFTVASLLCGTASSLRLLIAGRAAQGVGAALMMSVSLALVVEVVPPGRTGRTMGLLGTVSAVGTALGPALGGMLIAAAGWRAMFLLNLPLGLLALALAHRHLPGGHDAASRRAGFDVAGTLLLALALSCYALAMTLGSGGFGAANLGLLASAGLATALFARVEGAAAFPLIGRATIADRSIRAGLAATALVMTVMMATLVVGPFYLSLGLGLGPSSVGVVMAVGPLVAVAAGVPAGRLVDRMGPLPTSRVGLIALATGCCALACLPSSAGVAGYVMSVIAMTAGYAQFQAANTTLVMARAAPKQRGVASAMLHLARNLGLISGASLMGALFAAAAGAGDVAAAAPEAVSAGLRTVFAVGAALTAVALALTWSRRPPALVSVAAGPPR